VTEEDGIKIGNNLDLKIFCKYLKENLDQKSAMQYNEERTKLEAKISSLENKILFLND